MSRQTASDRFRRIVAIVPWIAERDGPRIDDVCAQFDVTREALLADLDIVFMVGIPPYTPDELIDVVIEDDRVWVTLGRYFTRPLRFTAQEAVGVLAAGAGLMATTGADPSGPLARGLAKLQHVVGIADPATLDIDLGGADSDTLRLLQDSTERRRSVDIDYYSYGSDETTSRRIDPYRVYATEGNWYVTGWCHVAEDERLFRVDRIRSAAPTDAEFDVPEVIPPATAYSGSSADRRIAIEVGPGDRWIAEHYPVDSVEDRPGGRLLAVLAVGGDAWLERLLLRLGPDANVVDLPETEQHGMTFVSREQARELLVPVVERIAAKYR
ncbi:MAG: WYL domain-containing protein [Microthrixaceae bacterium]|nr:WYL domain-containing protein [Microthrixaceae bacterium]